MKTMKTKITILIIFWGMLFTQQSHAQETASGIFVFNYYPNLKIEKPLDTLRIDINRDEIDDIAFFWVDARSGGTFCYVYPITCQYSNISASKTTDSLASETKSWFDIKWGFLNTFDFDKNIKIGIRFITEGKFYYGWISGELYVEGGSASNGNYWFSIDKFAYCNIPNYPLVWGQTYITGIASHTIAPGIKVTRHGQGESLSVLSENKDIKNVQVINLNGAIIKNEGFMPAKNVTMSTSGLNRGTYIVVATFTDNTRCTAKTAW
jgi:hypothetical protein